MAEKILIEWNAAADEIERLARSLKVYGRYKPLCCDLRAKRVGLRCDERLSAALGYLRQKLGIEI